MYFPYLYGKAAELLALRDYAGKLGKPQKIVPVIEPVTSAGGLVRLYQDFKTKGDVAYVIENPHLLDLDSAAALSQWTIATAALFADPTVVRPTFKERNGITPADISAFVARYPGRPVGLVVTTTRITAVDLKSALGSSSSLIFMTSDADRLDLATEFGTAHLVEVNDRFPKQRINADYSGEEWFTRDHLDYASPHGYPGFSDFTVLPGAPIAGGGAPGAVVVHLTFKASDGSIWVHHFVSDETDRAVGNAGSKLLEAARHIDTAVTADPTKFAASDALNEYITMVARRSATSPTRNKRLQIDHHLYEVSQILGI